MFIRPGFTFCPFVTFNIFLSGLDILDGKYEAGEPRLSLHYCMPTQMVHRLVFGVLSFSFSFFLLLMEHAMSPGLNRLFLYIRTLYGLLKQLSATLLSRR